MEDFEIGVIDAELYYSKNYEEWLEFRKKQFNFYPNDASTRYRYAEALYQTGKYNEAIVFLTKFHKDDTKDVPIDYEGLKQNTLFINDLKWSKNGHRVNNIEFVKLQGFVHKLIEYIDAELNLRKWK